MINERAGAPPSRKPQMPEQPGLLAHCQRVAYFTRFLSDSFDLPSEQRREIIDAALGHHFLLGFGNGALHRLEQDLKMKLNFAGPESEERPDAVSAFVSQIVEACNCLDETVEFAPFDGLSIAQALECFGIAGDPPLYRLLGLVLHSSRTRFDGGAAVRHVGQLPVVPRTMKRLLAMSDDTTTVEELESIASSDQVLAGMLVTRANSPLYSRLAETKTIRQAVLYLGLRASRMAMLAASFQTLFASSNLKQLWDHAVLAADAAQDLAVLLSHGPTPIASPRGSVEINAIDPAEAYLAGLVHDIGRLVVEKFPLAPRLLEAELVENGFPRTYAEAIAYRTDHAEMGAALLQSWNFPESLVTAVRYHHRPEANDSRMASLLYLTEILCEPEEDSRLEDLPSIVRMKTAEKRAGITLRQIQQAADAREQQNQRTRSGKMAG